LEKVLGKEKEREGRGGEKLQLETGVRKFLPVSN